MAGSGAAAAGATTTLGRGITFVGKKIPHVMIATLLAAAALEVYTRRNNEASKV